MASDIDKKLLEEALKRLGISKEQLLKEVQNKEQNKAPPIRKTQLKSQFKSGPKTFKDPSSLIKIDPTKKVSEKYRKQTFKTTLPKRERGFNLNKSKSQRTLEGFTKEADRHFKARFNKQQLIRKIQKELRRAKAGEYRSIQETLFAHESKEGGRRSTKLTAKILSKYGKHWTYYEKRVKRLEQKLKKAQEEYNRLSKISKKFEKQEQKYSAWVRSHSPHLIKKANRQGMAELREKIKRYMEALGVDSPEDLMDKLDDYLEGSGSMTGDQQNILRDLLGVTGDLNSEEGKEAIRELIREIKELLKEDK